MIKLEKHIEILLLWNDCVIVPGLGGFTASHVPARYDEEDCMFIPPLRTLGFNPKLTVNDSLLAQSYAEVYDTSYPEALKRIEEEVGELKQHIENEGSFTLNDIGTLYQADNGTICFTPCEAGVLTPALYSLSSFEFKKEIEPHTVKATQQAKKETAKTLHTAQDATADAATVAPTAEQTLTENEPDEEGGEGKTITIPLSVVRNIAAAVIAIIGFFLLSAPVDNSRQPIQMSRMDCGIVAQLLNPNTTAPAKTAGTKAVATDNAASKKAEAPVAQKTDVEREHWCLVLASHVTNKNAADFAAKLNKKGYKSARVLKEKGMSIKVVYGDYKSQHEAYNDLNNMNDGADFSEAWVYKLKE